MTGHRRAESATKVSPSKSVSREIRSLVPALRSMSISKAKGPDALHSYSRPHVPGSGPSAETLVRDPVRALSAAPHTLPPPCFGGNGFSSVQIPSTARAWPSLQNHDGRLYSAQAQRQAVNAVLLDAKNQQLRGFTQDLRAAWSPGDDPNHVDGAFDVYSGMQKAAMNLVRALGMSSNTGTQGHVARRPGSVEETVERLEMLSLASTSGHGNVDALRTSFGEMDISDTVDDDDDEAPGRGKPVNDAWLRTIRDWRSALQKLLDSHRASLTGTYRSYQRDATPKTIERVFVDIVFRAEAIHKMRNSPSFKAFAAAPAYWPKYERRFQNYDNLKRALEDVDRMLQWGTGRGDSNGVENSDRFVRDYAIARRGDTILEFANNNTSGNDSNNPVLRFRVSSHILVETSPLFARLFSESVIHEPIWEDDPLQDKYLSVGCPRIVTCPDGSETRLYSMPQIEHNLEDSLAILLHAAHMHTDRVPRTISFEQFVVIAEACIRYHCTSPLEVFVEHFWLPAWVHKAVEDQPDGLLVISYAFGLRRLFTRVSKTAVLNIVDEEELAAKPWPQKVRDRIWAVRKAKLAQIYSLCTSGVQEYFRPPMGNQPFSFPRTTGSQSHAEPAALQSRSRVSKLRHTVTSPEPHSYTPSIFSLSSDPRCPKGNHACDAANLGWLLLVLNELHLLSAVMRPVALTQSQQLAPRRSLAQLLDALRSVPGPPCQHPGHVGVCDPAPTFRSAVNDVYNSITGLTLFEVDGRRHGWALSKGKVDEPQDVLQVPLGVLGGRGQEDELVKSLPGNVVDEVSGDFVGTVARLDGVVQGDETGLLGGKRSNNMSIGKYHNIPALPFTPDEQTCLRILSFMDTSDDLYSASMTSRMFYAAFKHNELALMRRLVRAQRRFTLSVLVGAHIHDVGLFHEENRARRPVDRGHSDVSDSGCAVEDGSSSSDRPWDASEKEDVEPCREWKDETDSYIMTEEEAHHILWPDRPPGAEDVPSDICRDVLRPTSICAHGQPRDGDGEKVLVSHVAFLEEKMLVVMGDKSLREQHDQRMGILNE